MVLWSSLNRSLVESWVGAGNVILVIGIEKIEKIEKVIQYQDGQQCTVLMNTMHVDLIYLVRVGGDQL